MWGRIRTLIGKEFLAIWKDKKSRTVVIVPPILQLLVFGYAATFDVTHIATAVYDQDGGPAARDLVARFVGVPVFDPIVKLDRESEIAEVVDAKQVGLVVHVGSTFSHDLLGHPPAKVQFIVDGRQSNTALIILGYANAVLDSFDRDWAEAHDMSPAPASLVVRSWFNPNLLSRWFIVPGIVALLTLVVSIVVTALSVAREREIGTFEQLLVAPFRPIEILIGKSAPALLIGLGEASGIIALAVFWFGVPLRGSLLLLYLGLAIFLLSTIGVGLMISSLSRTQQQAIFGAFMFLVPAVILSGFATPIANMPEWVQVATVVNPARYFLEVVRGTFLQGMPAPLVLDLIWPMIPIALGTLGAAGWLFRHRLQ